MNLDLINDLVNNLKENKFVQSFMEELSNYIQNNVTNNSNSLNTNDNFNNLNSDNLTLNNNKIISKYKNEMLVERRNILQNYAEKTKDKGEMYYIYSTSTNARNSYNLCNCVKEKSHEVITKKIQELPEEANLGSVLRKKGEKFVLDKEATQTIGVEINNMIQEKIEEQNQYLSSKRIDGHIYEVGEKDSGRIWLYDLEKSTNGGMEGIEEIEISKELYEIVKEGDMLIYKNGEYQKHILD